MYFIFFIRKTRGRCKSKDKSKHDHDTGSHHPAIILYDYPSACEHHIGHCVIHFNTIHFTCSSKKKATALLWKVGSFFVRCHKYCTSPLEMALCDPTRHSRRQPNIKRKHNGKDSACLKGYIGGVLVEVCGHFHSRKMWS